MLFNGSCLLAFPDADCCPNYTVTITDQSNSLKKVVDEVEVEVQVEVELDEFNAVGMAPKQVWKKYGNDNITRRSKLSILCTCKMKAYQCFVIRVRPYTPRFLFMFC